MLRAPGRAVLWRPLRAASGGGGATGPGSPPDTIPGLSGWWDASAFGNLADANGNPLAGWKLPAAAITDLSGNHRPAMPYHYATTGNTPAATPRLSGTLGGCGYDLSTGPYYPTLDFDLGFQVPNVPMGAGAAWTRFFVWSRPNWKQNPYTTDPSASVLLCSGGTPVLQVDGSGGAGALTLFPGSGAPATLSSAVTRRHTHAVILVNMPGAGVSVWLDGTLAASGVTNPITGQGLATLLMLHAGTGPLAAGAQCWFHEAAAWERALTSAEIGGLGAYAARWALGPRKGVALLFNGQSNAAYYTGADGAALLLAQGVAWYLGALAYLPVTGIQNSGGAGTIVPGIGIYDYPGLGPASGVVYASTFLVDSHDGSDPSTWASGAMGNNVASFVAALSAADAADIGALVLLWSETDSYRSYSAEFTTFDHAAKQWLAKLRATVPGATAANMPAIWWNAIPFGNTDGIQMHREVIASLAADPTQLVVIAPQMTADSNSRGATWDPTTGIQTGGDNQHRDGGDNVIFARRAAPVVARALVAQGRQDSLAAIPAGLPAAGGPKIVHAYRQSNTVLILTVQHDAGSDLKVQLQALAGAGFLVMDGGSVTAPGMLVPATACARVDATHLQITLAQALVNPSASCLLFYPYGSYTPTGAPTYRADMGRGNAVTDNFSTVAKPAGWDIGGDLGSAWNLDYPLAATTGPVVLSDTPT